MLPWLGVAANAFSAHGPGREAMAAIDRARAQVGAMAGWAPAGVTFTSGATEANATVLTRGRWFTSAVEHPSVLAWATRTLPVDSAGRVSLELPDLTGATGISVMYANNETGVVQPVAELARVARRAGLLFHVDASQAPGRLALGLDADFVTLSAHKFGGPQGVGALLVRLGAALEPLLRGGPQERGRRAGTPNVAGIVGMGAAAAVVWGLANASPIPPGSPLSALRDRLEAALVTRGGRVAGAGAARLPNTTCVAFDGIEAALLVMALDLEGVAVSAGSACASGSTEPSHVLAAMGFAGSAVRFSLGSATTGEAIDQAVAAVDRVLGRV